MDVVDYNIVDDFGVVLNPMLVEGQVHGGIVQGIGQALLEGAVYDDSGQLLTGSFMDYTMPRADNMPSFDFSTVEVPCKNNAMGVKGCGEAGSVGAPAAVINALVDALWPIVASRMSTCRRRRRRCGGSHSSFRLPESGAARREPAGNSAVICKTSIDTASLKSPSCRLAPVRGGLFLASGYGHGEFSLIQTQVRACLSAHYLGCWRRSRWIDFRGIRPFRHHDSL